MKTSGNRQRYYKFITNVITNFTKCTGKHLCQSLFFNKVAGQAWLVHNMPLKAQKLNQGATEMFISKFENKESLCNAVSEIYKNGDTKKSKFQLSVLTTFTRCIFKIQWSIYDTVFGGGIVNGWKLLPIFAPS